MIIGLAGPIGSGKDTMANYLVTHFQAHRLKFADTLYAMAGAFDSNIHPDMPHKAKDEYVLNNVALGTRRNFLEKLGTEFGREQIATNIWVLKIDHEISKLKFLLGAEVNIVISDVRFPNEAKYIRDNGGHIVHLKPNWECSKTGHASDKGLPYVDGDSILPLQLGSVNKGGDLLMRILEEVQAEG